MEGLLPMVYRRIKHGKTPPRPLRKSLSTAAYNIADFYPEGYNYRYPVGSPSAVAVPPPPPLQVEMKTVANNGHHRRWNSSIGDYNSSGNKSQQLVRYRSSKTFLSCVTGGD